MAADRHVPDRNRSNSIMEKRDYYPILESILFTMGKSVEIKTLAEALKLTQEEIKQILQDMAKE